jgi:hypothetical protein
MKEPDGRGAGCMLYPIGGCDTQPLITIANITLQNVQQYSTLLPPGVVRCNETNPCTGFVFDNVNADGWWKWFGFNYITENIQGEALFDSPRPAFLDKNGESQVSQTDLFSLLVQILNRSSFHFEELLSEIEPILAEQGVFSPFAVLEEARNTFSSALATLTF